MGMEDNMTEKNERTVSLDVGVGMTLRFALLKTHYRSPCELGPATRNEAKKALRRLAMACEPCLSLPPPEFIAMLHGYRHRKEGKKLFAAMRFLGFWGDMPGLDEIKTLPADHVWAAQWSGPATIGPEQ